MKRAKSFLSTHGLDVIESESKGRFVVATKEFGAGQIVHPWTQPYAAAVRKDKLLRCCSYCLSEAQKLLVCSKCKYVRYCSKECQKLDWVQGHRALCPNISKILPNKPTESLILMSKILLRLRAEKAGVVMNQHSFEDIQILQSHKNKTKESDLEMYTKMSAMVVHLVGPETLSELDMTVDTIIDLFCKFRSNNYNIYDDQMNTIGIGIYPVLSLINHSCAPNCVPMFDGQKVKLVSLRPIKVGEEVNISYIEIASPTLVRQQELEEHFFFTCQCSRCLNVDEDNLLCSLQSGVTKQKADEISLQIKKNSSDIEKLDVSSQHQEIIEKLDNSLALVKSTYLPMTYTYLRTADEAAKLFLDLSEWKRAKECLIACIPACERVYPHLWPMLGIEYYTLGKLEWYIENDESAEHYLVKAQKILSKLFDSNSPFLLELNRTLGEVKAMRQHNNKR